MPAPVRVTLGLQLRPPCAAAAFKSNSRGGCAATRRAPRPARASSEPENEQERIYVAPNWVRYPLPGSPAGASDEEALTSQVAPPPPAGLARLSRADAAGLVMSAVFGMGAPLPGAEQNPPVPIPLSSSPRRTRVVSFLCNVCDQRTLRRVNPVALETGTTFVQCSNAECLVYHKLVDNLGLFHELQTRFTAGGVDVLGLDAPVWPADEQ